MAGRVLARLDELRPEWVEAGLSWGAGVKFDCPTHGPQHKLVMLFQNPIDGFPVNREISAIRYERTGASFSQLTFGSRVEMGACFSGYVIEGEFLVTHLGH